MPMNRREYKMQFLKRGNYRKFCKTENVNENDNCYCCFPKILLIAPISFAFESNDLAQYLSFLVVVVVLRS